MASGSNGKNRGQRLANYRATRANQRNPQRQ